jgi:hypothetical protein
LGRSLGLLAGGYTLIWVSFDTHHHTCYNASDVGGYLALLYGGIRGHIDMTQDWEGTVVDMKRKMELIMLNAPLYFASSPPRTIETREVKETSMWLTVKMPETGKLSVAQVRTEYNNGVTKSLQRAGISIEQAVDVLFEEIMH